jgi:hypothetical protein
MGNLKIWIYGSNTFLDCSCSLPEDFFIVGSGRDLKNAEWHFALAADVAKDLKKVRLWFVADDLPAKEKGIDGGYHLLFKFSDLKNFINGIVIPKIC